LSALSSELFTSAQVIQDSGTNPQAAQLFLLAAAQENAQDAYDALKNDADTAANLQTVTATVTAQTKRLAADIAKARSLATIATNILTVIAGASNPVSVAPTLATVVQELSS